MTRLRANADFNAEEQRFAEENAESKLTLSASLRELRGLCDLRFPDLGSGTELQVQHQLFDVGHGDRILLDRF